MFWSTLVGTGCGIESWIEKTLDYAYKKDAKLVIIEKSFFGNDLNAGDYETILYNKQC